MPKSKPVRLPIPPWATKIYILFTVILLPWTIYLSYQLPARHIVHHWDVSWVGLDIGLMATFVTTSVLAYKRSKWVAVSATVTGTLLIMDAWFDILGAHHGLGLLESITLAVVCEIPVAIMSFALAFHVLDKNLD